MKRLLCSLPAIPHLFTALITTSISCLAAKAGEPAYLNQIWENRATGYNLIRIPHGASLAVADDGSHLVDASIIPLEVNPGFRFETLQRLADGFYLARDMGGNGFNWIRVGDGESFLTSTEVEAAMTAPVFNTQRFLSDPDPLRGDLGVAYFPEGGIALYCAREYPSDRRVSGVSPASPDGNPEPFASNDEVTLYMQTPFVSSVRAEDLPDRVILHEDGKGFWYLGSLISGGPRKMILGHARPGVNADGSRDLNLDPILAVSDDSSRDRFDTAVRLGDDLLLLIAREEEEIGGWLAARRLLRISPDSGIVAEEVFSFDHHAAGVRAAIAREDLVLHSPDEIVLIDTTTLRPKWRKSVSDLLGGENPLGHRIARVATNDAGDQIALALDTPLRRSNEANQIISLNLDGTTASTTEARPAPIDQLRFTADGGLLLYTSAYTAKIGGNTPVAENEKAAVSKAMAAFEKPTSAPATATAAVFSETPSQDRHKLWFDKPAPGYGRQSLPIGNGHLGAMLTGGIDAESVTFNVDSMWQGDDRDMGQYQAFGLLTLALGHDPEKVTNYRRELDLRTGLHVVTYEHEGVAHRRETFASYPHGVLGMRISADQPGSLSGMLELQAMHFAQFSKNNDGMEFTGTLPNGRSFQATLRLHASGGEVFPEKGESGTRSYRSFRRFATKPFDSIVLENCDEIILYLAADTDFAFDPENHFFGTPPEEKISPRIAHTENLTFDELRDASAADVAALFDRCTIQVATTNPAAEALPIDQRRAAYYKGADDQGLEVLAFDAVRHMMIASSRPGSLPANLQGIWNDSNWPAWTSDYHADINLQMAYWFVDPTNLAECNQPLFDYIESQIPFRRRAAKEVFGEHVRDWTVDYMNGIFGGGGYANYPPGSAWYAWHFADHFKFTQDPEFLEKRTYPVLKELSKHWQDLLIERPDGTLVTPRTFSPEHKPMQYGLSHDGQLVHSLFSDFMAASNRLDQDADFRAEVEQMRSRLIPMQIGRWGQFQEWEADRDSRYCVHRHINHLIAAFPDRRITPDAEPELSQAVITGLEARGIGGTGWSKVWRMPIFARLREPELLGRQLRASLRDFHDHLIWESYSQIDAPAGYTAGIVEALLQSHETVADDDSRFVIHLLPALPPSWQHGRVNGLRARGGFEVDLEWQDGKLTRAAIRNIASPVKNAVVRIGDETREITIARGAEADITP